MKPYKLLLILLVWGCLHFSVSAQDRITAIEKQLTDLAQTVPGLDETVDFSVNNVSVQELIRGLAKSHNLNASVDPSLNAKVINSFSNVSVKEVLVFLCKAHDLKIDFTGSIMSFRPYVKPERPKPKYVAKKLEIKYLQGSDKLSLDLKRDTLYLVAKEISKQTGKNVVLSPGLENNRVSAFIHFAPFEDALEQMAFSNGLAIEKDEKGFYKLMKLDAKAAVVAKKKNKQGENFELDELPSGLKIDMRKDAETGVEQITVTATNVPIADIIKQVSYKLGTDYFLFSEPQGNATLNVDWSTYPDFLTYLLNGTQFTYKKEGDIYLFGERTLEGLRDFKVVQLQNRSVDKIEEVIPAELKQDVNITPFPELNSLLVSGSAPVINEIEYFLKSIDKVVPLVLIEVKIVDVNNTSSINTTLAAGLGEQPTTTNGSILDNNTGGVNVNWGANSVNNLISVLNGNQSLINLGKVTPNFYVSLQALETNGHLKIRSTPKLSTLNGHEATMSIGKTEYYLNISSNIIGTQNPQTVNNRTWQSTNADLNITIKPFVSGDEQVTLDIAVQQSDFTARIAPDAPPGTVSRNFESLIRVKNEETIVLGGLIEKSVNNSGSGVPFLAKIPIVKWLFSSRVKERSKSKLTVLIKPTIIY